MKRHPWKTVIRPAAGGLVLAAALLAGSAAPAGADWLVTREGGRVETRGAWEVKGKLVVFHTAGGNLASLRLSDVDLEASRAATDEAERRKTQTETAKPKPPRRPSIVSLTDKDFRKPEPPAEAAKPADPNDPDVPAEPEAPAPAGLAVTTWERGTAAGSDGYAVITGTLHNTSGAMAADVRLGVAIYDETGRLIARGLATLDSAALPPGQQTGFRAEFPGFFGFADVRFDPSSVNLNSGPASEPAPVNGGG
jgi:hypothetical protein